MKTNFKNLKIITFSYDDAPIYDIKLVELFNRHNIKATFNINSGKAIDALVKNNFWHIPYDKLQEIYSGHEIASHTLSHRNLTKLSDEEMFAEISLDIKNLEIMIKDDVKGLAYPYGQYDKRIISYAKKSKLKYCRTANSTHSFNPPASYFEWNPTCHHDYPEINKLIDKFLCCNSETVKVLYIWGHSNEFEQNGNWEHIETICKKISNIKNILYMTNIDTLNYLNQISFLK